MYIKHQTFKQPSNENEKVWRYMDFTKFVSLLEENALYFTRADKFEDPYEGSLPLRYRQAISDFRYDHIPEKDRQEERDSQERLHNNFIEFSRHLPKYILINCWHLNYYESAAMWGLYRKSNESIAIQSTYLKLRECFNKNKEHIYLGKINYINYDVEQFEFEEGEGFYNIFKPFLHKRRSFEHEREFRAIIEKLPKDSGNEGFFGYDISQETVNHGVNIEIDLDLLIEKIYVAPDAPVWFAELVKSIIKRYGKKYEVIHSTLNRAPSY